MFINISNTFEIAHSDHILIKLCLRNFTALLNHLPVSTTLRSLHPTPLAPRKPIFFLLTLHVMQHPRTPQQLLLPLLNCEIRGLLNDFGVVSGMQGLGLVIESFL